jgi:hypothetical protein
MPRISGAFQVSLTLSSRCGSRTLWRMISSTTHQSARTRQVIRGLLTCQLYEFAMYHRTLHMFEVTGLGSIYLFGPIALSARSGVYAHGSAISSDRQTSLRVVT